MDDHKNLQILQEDCPTRKLNLNVPPLSTRRPPFTGETLASAATASGGGSAIMPAADMVPFSWERIPGEPKLDARHPEMSPPPTPAPRLPPGRRWLPQQPTTMDHEEAENCTDNECGGEGDDDDDNMRLSGSISDYACGRAGDHDDRFSDAIDIFSLAESTGEDMETGDCGFSSREAKSKSRSKERRRSKTRSILLRDNSSDDDYQWLSSSHFMIQRFLPDAQALAEESITNKITRTRTKQTTNKELIPLSADSSTGNFPGGAASSYSPKLGCGLGSFFLFPWRMKPKPCSVKSPVCDTIYCRPAESNHHKQQNNC